MKSRGGRSASVALVVAGALAILAAVGLEVDRRAGGGAKPPRPEEPLRFAEPGPRDRAVVWAIGDGEANEGGRRVTGFVASRHVDRVLYLGDVYEEGTDRDFRDNFAPTYGRFARRTLPTPGNHEWPRRAEGYLPYWRRAAGATPPPFYASSAGGWELLSLNSEVPHGRRSAQLRWLRSRLRRPGTCRLAFWHRPRYSAGIKHGNQEDTEPLWDALEGHATLVLGGHDHGLQRFAPREGLTQMISGAGGRELYPIEEEREGLEFAYDDDFGALRLELTPGRARWEFLTAGGKSLDRGEVGCRRG